MAVKRLGDLAESIWTDGNLSSALALCSKTALIDVLWYFSISAFSGERLWTSLFKNIFTRTVRSGTSNVRVDTSSKTLGLAKYSYRAFSSGLKGEILKAFSDRGTVLLSLANETDSVSRLIEVVRSSYMGLSVKPSNCLRTPLS